MLNEAEHWFVTAAAGNHSAARDFVGDEWPIVKDFFRNQIAPHAA